MLNNKLDLLLRTLSIESEATSTPPKELLPPDSPPENNQLNSNGKNQKVFVPKDALMSRANSLKKAIKQIIEHTETGYVSEHAQT